MRRTAAIAMVTMALIAGPGPAAVAAPDSEAAGDKPSPAREGDNQGQAEDDPKTTKREVVPEMTVRRGSQLPADIRRVIQKNQGRFKRCYQQGLDRNRNLKGRIDVHFSIGAKGAVLEAGVRETTMHDEKVEACVVKAMRGLRFPRQRGGIVAITYPFVFGPA